MMFRVNIALVPTIAVVADGDSRDSAGYDGYDDDNDAVVVIVASAGWVDGCAAAATAADAVPRIPAYFGTPHHQHESTNTICARCGQSIYFSFHLWGILTNSQSAINETCVIGRSVSVCACVAGGWMCVRVCVQ